MALASCFACEIFGMELCSLMVEGVLAGRLSEFLPLHFSSRTNDQRHSAFSLDQWGVSVRFPGPERLSCMMIVWYRDCANACDISQPRWYESAHIPLDRDCQSR